jgi:ubiquinone/menaquinone biosynthesis C-methylase UbiE
MTKFLYDKTPTGFSTPTALPKTPEESRQWQDANRCWWESHPMRYDFGDHIGEQEFSPEFYRTIDTRFFRDVKTFMPWKAIPFDNLIEFDSLRQERVLEIGVGNGSHAQLLAEHAKSFVGIDITDYAVKSTRERLRLTGLKGDIIRMDAEHMGFPDNSFDFVWSWGVIHHSSNTENVLREILRVLRPGGKAITMVYHRNVWNYLIVSGLVHGIIQGGLLQTRSLHKTRQLWMDGALARFYSSLEWRMLTSRFFTVEDIKVFGSKAELVPLPRGRVKNGILAVFPDSLGRLITNRWKFGTFLVSTLKKSPMFQGTLE